MAKALSLKLDEPTYLAAEKIRKKLKVPRTRTFAKQLAIIMRFTPGNCWSGNIAKASRRLGRRTWNI